MTKSILPWQVKPGMRVPYRDVDGSQRVGIVKSVERTKAVFAGGNMTVAHLVDNSVPIVLHHRKPVSRLEIEVNI